MAITPWHYYVTKQVAEEQKRYINSSTGRVSYNFKKFQQHPIKVPHQELIDKFNAFCKPIFELQKNNEQQIRKLERLQKAWIETLE